MRNPAGTDAPIYARRHADLSSQRTPRASQRQIRLRARLRPDTGALSEPHRSIDAARPPPLPADPQAALHPERDGAAHAGHLDLDDRAPVGPDGEDGRAALGRLFYVPRD